MLIPFTQVDAFASGPHEGNPAAVMRLESWLDDATLLAIAGENNLSETAFTVPTRGDADYELRWFTPTTEVALCGHATLASGHVLLTGDAIRFRTRKAGVLTVARARDALTLDLPVTLVEPANDAALLDILGTPDARLFLSHRGAEQTAIVLLPDAAAVRACAPDMKALAKIDLMIIVTASGSRADVKTTASGDDADIVSRVFVPAWGVEEDPVTGSAHAALAPFWVPRLGRDTFTAYQASKRGGRLTCRLAGTRVILGGTCVTVIEGAYRL